MTAISTIPRGPLLGAGTAAAAATSATASSATSGGTSDARAAQRGVSTEPGAGKATQASHLTALLFGLIAPVPLCLFIMNQWQGSWIDKLLMHRGSLQWVMLFAAAAGMFALGQNLLMGRKERQAAQQAGRQSPPNRSDSSSWAAERLRCLVAAIAAGEPASQAAARLAGRDRECHQNAGREARA